MITNEAHKRLREDTEIFIEGLRAFHLERGFQLTEVNVLTAITSHGQSKTVQVTFYKEVRE